MGFYFHFLYAASYFTQALPFMIAFAIFYPWYQFHYRRHTARVRTRILVKLQSKWLRVIALILVLVSLLPVIVHQRFNNEFVRLMILTTAIAFTYWSELHWILRIIVSDWRADWVQSVAIHLFVIFAFETYYLRELLMQCACYERGKCVPI